MISPNELRIGNWYNTRLYEPFRLGQWDTINKVSESPKFAMCEGQIQESPIISEYIDKLKPIPITPEWLEKFGFKKGRKQRYFIMYNEKRRTLEIDLSNFVVSVEHPFAEMSIAETKSVHQLQNLYFSLTHTELEVK